HVREEARDRAHPLVESHEGFGVANAARTELLGGPRGVGPERGRGAVGDRRMHPHRGGDRRVPETLQPEALHDGGAQTSARDDPGTGRLKKSCSKESSPWKMLPSERPVMSSMSFGVTN